MLRSTLLAAAALALAVPVHAATLELRAGPVTLVPGQIARTLVTNASPSLCRCRLTVARNAVAEDLAVGPARLATTDSALPGGAGLVGYQDPDLMPAVMAELVQASAVVECRSLTLAQVREAARLSLELAPGRFATPTLALQGVEAR